MTIKQLSVFLENRTGRINEVAKILGTNNINMKAFSMAETADFGILRLVVSEVDRAAEILRAHSFAVMTTDVICISVPNVPGGLSAILDKLADNDIFIEYMYAFSEGEIANVIIRANETAKCVKVLEEYGCQLSDTI